VSLPARTDQASGLSASPATIRRHFPKDRVPLALLFDVDGVLVDSVGWTYAAYLHALDAVGMPRPSEDSLRAVLSLAPRSALRTLCGDQADWSAALLAYSSFTAASAGRQREYLRPFAGMPQVLAGLRAAGVRMGAVTSRNRADALRHLHAGGVESLMEAIVTYGDARPHKPHPAPVLRGLELLAVDTLAVAYIGDTTDDLAAARGAGVLAIAAVWSDSCDIPALLAAHPDGVLKEPRDLWGLVKRRPGG
jgi:phosphoglycolate phosphatase-like HAD superfamily hydrolase